ncbi:MAG TPA: hypothetical protein ENI33_01600 [Thermoplasmatales archaeon]|nr:hypothetical protein [Thermoplasmatales archaeon]
MVKTNIPNIGRKFLTDIDEYLKESRQKLTCDDIYEIYNQFFHDLKEFKGNSSGFYGLSEYLIFRMLYNLLIDHSGPFKRSETACNLWENNKFRIGQSSRVTVGNKRYRPDIVVYNKSDELIAVIHSISESKKFRKINSLGPYHHLKEGWDYDAQDQ